MVKLMVWWGGWDAIISFWAKFNELRSDSDLVWGEDSL